MPTPKKKKPNTKKTSTFKDYKTAASQFADYNPQSDTVFVGMSLDPSSAEQQTQRAANVSKAKGASDSNYNAIPKMYKTKNESGQTVYVSLSKHDKYSNGGMMKAKKYQKGGELSFEEKANMGNDAAKALETGKTKDGFPLTAAMRKKLEKIAKTNKNIQLMSPAPFEDDGMRGKGGMMPKYKKGGKMKMDFNKDGKITKADFIMMAKANAKKKGKK